MLEKRALAIDVDGAEKVVIICDFVDRQDMNQAGGKAAPQSRYFLEGHRGTYGRELSLENDGTLREPGSDRIYRLR
ncbi:hypothetical protein EHS39_23715 [Ensifer sp. MPMI2T]|nr:hypothetical protein EHS39_23715 [Ensifer sp. MPMI2T]